MHVFAFILASYCLYYKLVATLQRHYILSSYLALCEEHGSYAGIPRLAHADEGHFLLSSAL